MQDLNQTTQIDEDAYRTVDGIVIQLEHDYVRTYHLPAEVSKYKTELWFPLDYEDNDELIEAGERADKLTHDLQDIFGIDSVILLKYKVSVIIGRAFTWNGVEEQILEALRIHFRTELEINQLPLDCPPRRRRKRRRCTKSPVQ